jgi:hypothetical protein
MVVNLEPWLIESQDEAYIRKNRSLEYEIGPDKVPLEDAGLGFFIVL